MTNSSCDAICKFAETICSKNGEIDLAQACLAISLLEYPSLIPQQYIDRLDAMAWAIIPRLRGRLAPNEKIHVLNSYLFDEEGFAGNEKNFYDPRNSFLNDVLDRKLGIPITLSAAYMEIARRLELPIYGVGFPQHFLVKYQDENVEIVIDPFNQGFILSKEDCINRIRLSFGGKQEFRDHFLASITKKQMLGRVLNNLKAIYISRCDYSKALCIVDMLLVLSPWHMDEIRDRGILYYRLENYKNALQDLETYQEFNKDATDYKQINRVVAALRQLAAG